MRYFRKNNGAVAAFESDQLTKYELIDKVAQLNNALEMTGQREELTSAKDALDAINIDNIDVSEETLEQYQIAMQRVNEAEAAYQSCEEYKALQRLKNTKIWIPDDAVEMTEEEIQAHLNPVVTDEQLAATARAQRDTLLEQFTWRYERHARERRLDIEATDSIEALDAYSQALADVPQQAGFPTIINWPTVPA